MALEMFLGLGLSGLLIMMFGKSPTPSTTKPKNTSVTIVFPDCDGTSPIVQNLQEAGFENR